jgi:hypothetical protein
MKNLTKRKEALVKRLEELKTGKKSEEEFQFTCSNGSNITIDVKGLTKEKNGIKAGEFVRKDKMLALCVGQGEGRECHVLNSTSTKKQCIWFLYENGSETILCFEEVKTLKESGFTLVP